MAIMSFLNLTIREKTGWSLVIITVTIITMAIFYYFSPKTSLENNENPLESATKEQDITLRINGVPFEKRLENLEDDLKSIPLEDMSEPKHITLVRANKHSACVTATFRTSLPDDELTRKLQVASKEKAYPYRFGSEFYGITPLYGHENEAHVDLVAVCGLGIHAFQTWKSPGYNTKLQTSQSKQSIGDLGDMLTENLTSFRQATGALLRAHSLSVKASNLHKACYAMLFFGVPNLGLRYKQLRAVIRCRPTERLVESLIVDSDSEPSAYLKRITDQFSSTFEGQYVFVNFYELNISPIIDVHDDGTITKTSKMSFLVTRESATKIGVVSAAQEDNVPLHTNHSKLVKFESMYHQPYTIVLERLRRIVEKAVNDVARRFSEESLYQPTSKSTIDCLQSLAFPEMISRHNDILIARNGTYTWLQSHPSFQDWCSRFRALLWIKGKPGSGKSTLMKHALETTKSFTGGEDFIVSFFFHGRGGELQKSPLGFYRSIIHQLLLEFPGALSDLVDKFTERWHREELRGFLEKSLHKILKTKSVIIFVDALDEAGENSAVKLVKDFQRLLEQLPQTKFHFRICFSCRFYPILEADYKSGDGLTILVSEENNADIKRHVEANLNQLLSHREDYASLITSRAAGVFLWVDLVVRQVLDLEREANNHITIKKEIEKIPRDLDELYRSLIRDLKRPKTTLRLVQWVCFALRPLTADELRWAIAIDPDGRHKTLQDCRNSEHFLEDDKISRGINVLSCGLVEVIHAENRTVQFIHQSVKDFFTEHGLALLQGNSKTAHMVLEEANYFLVSSCLQYVAMEEISEEQSPMRKRAAFPHGMSYRGSVRLGREYPFLQYAVLAWIRHAQIIQEVRSAISADYLMKHFDQPSNKLLDRWVLLHAVMTRLSYQEPILTILLHEMSRYGLTDTISAIMKNPGLKRDELDARDYEGDTPLHVAEWTDSVAPRRNEDIAAIELLLDKKANPNPLEDWGDTRLHEAAQRGQIDTAQILVDAGADIDAADGLRPTPLLDAAVHGETTAVPLLIADGVDVNYEDSDGRTTLLNFIDFLLIRDCLLARDEGTNALERYA
ncbi:hypothetical protein GGR55DRAFT_694079 [Xylaria sp. FL0064]|nr:hypothetical protein GGR55DRAFT_694079 [Xylaria sp. FL0064]